MARRLAKSEGEGPEGRRGGQAKTAGEEGSQGAPRRAAKSDEGSPVTMNIP